MFLLSTTWNTKAEANTVFVGACPRRVCISHEILMMIARRPDHRRRDLDQEPGTMREAAESAEMDDLDSRIAAASGLLVHLSLPFVFSTPNGAVARHVNAAPARIVSHRTSQCPPRRRVPSPTRIPSGPIFYLHRTASHPSSPSQASTARIPSHPPHPIALSPPPTRPSSPPDCIA
ncbi:hypothetical protein C8R44DRAFT_888566 [Mycena epipterygia]|nr:hypothetical protein C8R44DRAFT_888566 [Mycena epipterygia]